MTEKRFYKFSFKIFFFSLIGTAVCQIGMLFTCLHPGSVMHMPSLKSTALVFAVALLTEILLFILLEYVIDYSGRTSAWLMIISVFLLLTVIQNLLHPLTASDGRVACRYPMLAAIGFSLCCCELLNRKTRPDFRKLFCRPDFRKPETVFAAIALIFGLGMCLILPVETVLCWDDETHYKSTLVFSEGLYTAFDEGDVHMFFNYWEGPAENREENIKTILQKEQEGKVYLEAQTKAFDLRNIGYIGPAAGLWLGEILQLNLPIRFILGRIGGLLMYTLIMYYAVKQMNSGKMLLILLGLAPICLYFSVCYSYDAWMMAFTCLSFATFFGALQRPEEKLSARECVIILGAMMIGLCPKMPYIPLMLLFLLMPREKFADSCQRRNFILGIFGCMAFAFAYTLVTSFGIADVADVRGGGEISGIGQIGFILQNPLEYANILRNFSREYFRFPQSQGYLSSFAHKGETEIYLLLLAAMAAAAVTDSRGRIFCGKKNLRRIPGTVILYGVVLLIATTMYLSFTAVGADRIEGCQQRYMLQLLFPLLMLCGSGWIQWKGSASKRYRAAVYAVSVFCLSWNIAALLL